jgi:hypothetical protein
MSFTEFQPDLPPFDVPLPQPALPVPAGGWPGFPRHWPAQADLIDWCQHMGSGVAILLVLLGVVYLLFGFYLFKWLVVLNAAVVGAALGAALGAKAGATLPGGILGGFTAAAITWPLMKWAVAIMGGIFGAALGASVWKTLALEPAFAWTGAAMGLIFCGLLCFILFRGSVMMYTSLQGSVMLVFGIVGLIYKYPDAAGKITATLQKPYLLPIVIFIPALLGMVYQHGSMAPPEPAGKGK